VTPPTIHRPLPPPVTVVVGPDTFSLVDRTTAALPLAPETSPTTIAQGPTPLARWFALGQAILVCGIPTQLTIAVVLIMFAGLQPLEGDSLSLEFLATLSLFDTAVVALLIRIFLIIGREHSRDVFLGRRTSWKEALRGLVLVPVVFIAVTLIVLTLRTLVPWLHTVKESPLEAFMRTPLDAAIFLVVVVLAGGVREELQRAFILHRFRQYLGGIRLGLVIFSVTFGLLHLEQGADVAIAIGLLGLFWGVLYAKRRSAVMPMVNHAGFNAAQVAQQMIVRSLGL
jgi:membrane protease YdiL (CAAX protease family)